MVFIYISPISNDVGESLVFIYRPPPFSPTNSVICFDSNHLLTTVEMVKKSQSIPAKNAPGS